MIDGEGAKSILPRFKKVVRSAVDQGIMAKDPCKGVVCVVDDQVLKKDVLSQEEIQKLMETHYQFKKENVHNAFIFCLYTGMRFCDVKDLRYSNIDYANKLMRFEQDKNTETQKSAKKKILFNIKLGNLTNYVYLCTCI